MTSIDKLISDLASVNTRLASEAWHTLYELNDERIIPPLIRALDDPNPLLVQEAASLLGAFGSAAISAIPALVKLTSPEHPKELRTAAISALGVIQQMPEISINALRVAIVDPSIAVRQYAAAALSLFNPHHLLTYGAIPALIQASKDDDPNVREFAAPVLAELGKTSEEIIHFRVA